MTPRPEHRSARAVRRALHALLIAALIATVPALPPAAAATAAAVTAAVPGSAPPSSAGARSVQLPVLAPEQDAARRAGKRPVYREPRSYRGLTEAPVLRRVRQRPVTLSRTGDDPDVYVDEAGTAHITWNEGRAGRADVVRYCRLRRTARSCDTTVTLAWSKTYGPGDHPNLNVNVATRIARVGDQLIIISKRFPTYAAKPDGCCPSDNVIMWVSNNGGTSWSGGRVVSARNIDQLDVVDTASGPMVVSFAGDPACGGACLSTIRPGTYTNQATVLGPKAHTHDHTLTRAGRRLVAAMTDASVNTLGYSRMWLTEWKGTRPIADVRNWTPPTVFRGYQTELAGGRSGLFLLSRPGLAGPLRVQKVGSGLQPGRARPVAPDRARHGVLDQDPAGRLRVAWVDPSSGLRIRTSTPRGTGFDDPLTVLKGSGIRDLAMSATGDGGGFVLARRDEGVTAVGVGNRAPTGRRGLGGLAGGGNVSCTTVDFARFQLKVVGGCWLSVKGSNGTRVQSNGPVTLNGLRIEPLGQAGIVVDVREHTINTVNGQVRVVLARGGAEIELFRGLLRRDLAKVRPGTNLFEFSKAHAGVRVLGFPVAAGVPVILTETGVRIPIEVRLPAELGRFTGKAVLVADTGRGLRLSSLRIRIGPIPMGVAVLERVVLDWAEGGTWNGSGQLLVPAGGRIRLDVSFVGGSFAGAGFGYKPIPAPPVGPYVYLTEVSGDLRLQPETRLSGQATLGAGGPIQGTQPVTAVGTFTMTLPRGAPGRFRLDGKVSVVGLNVSSGHLEFVTDGYAKFGARTQIDLGPIRGGVNLRGFVDGTDGRFGVQASTGLTACKIVKDPTGQQPDREVCDSQGGVEFALSSIGIAACGKVLGESVGLASRWEDLDVANPGTLIAATKWPCNTSAYTIPPPRRVRAAERQLAAGSSSFHLMAGPSATILVQGRGGVPDVRVTGPGGRVLVGPGARGARLRGVPGAHAVWVLIDRPAGGTHTVTPAPGSVPLGPVKVSRGMRLAGVRASVEARVISYRIRRLGAGQAVTFRERGGFGTHDLRTTRRRTGTVRIKPAPGPGGRRVVEAVVTYQGLPKKVVRIGAYRAPGRKAAGKVAITDVVKRGSRVIVKLQPARRGFRTQLVVRGNTGDRVTRFWTGRRGRVMVRGFKWDRKVVVVAQAWSRPGLPGKRVRVVRRF